jgi:type VI secretion system FHA domain protein
VILTLEVTAPQAAALGAASLKKFGPAGGIIGRNNNNDWVLPHSKVSGCHARISFVNGAFFLEDMSTNGVFLNSRTNRLPRGRPHALKSGDRIVIDPYEIDVSIGTSSPLQHDDDPFGQRAFPALQEDFSPRASSKPVASVGDDSEQELDPLKLLGGPAKRPPAPPARTAKDLEASSRLVSHFKPPAVVQTVPLPTRPEPTLIPADYDPLAPDDPPALDDSPGRSFPLPSKPSGLNRPPSIPSDDWAPAVRSEVLPEPAVSAVVNAPIRPESADAPSPGTPQVVKGDVPSSLDLAAVLEGAGLDRVTVTPDLARSFGQILRVVVAGVMEVLRARHQIKDEFRMRVTQVRPVDNNPLKFSANVDDALHNLLVKRNAAFLKPVEAFEDAFDDLRNHQIAVLAGMRTAYESMLAQFDPDRLQEHFDRQLKKKGSILGMPAKLRYWELYRDRYQEAVSDPEASFTKLFGEEFAKAYEQQLKRLKAEKIGEKGST